MFRPGLNLSNRPGLFSGGRTLERSGRVGSMPEFLSVPPSPTISTQEHELGHEHEHDMSSIVEETMNIDGILPGIDFDEADEEDEDEDEESSYYMEAEHPQFTLPYREVGYGFEGRPEAGRDDISDGSSDAESDNSFTRTDLSERAPKSESSATTYTTSDFINRAVSNSDDGYPPYHAKYKGERLQPYDTQSPPRTRLDREVQVDEQLIDEEQPQSYFEPSEEVMAREEWTPSEPSDIDTPGTVPNSKSQLREPHLVQSEDEFGQDEVKHRFESTSELYAGRRSSSIDPIPPATQDDAMVETDINSGNSTDSGSPIIMTVKSRASINTSRTDAMSSGSPPASTRTILAERVQLSSDGLSGDVTGENPEIRALRDDRLSAKGMDGADTDERSEAHIDENISTEVTEVPSKSSSCGCDLNNAKEGQLSSEDVRNIVRDELNLLPRREPGRGDKGDTEQGDKGGTEQGSRATGAAADTSSNGSCSGRRASHSFSHSDKGDRAERRAQRKASSDTYPRRYMVVAATAVITAAVATVAGVTAVNVTRAELARSGVTTPMGPSPALVSVSALTEPASPATTAPPPPGVPSRSAQDTADQSNPPQAADDACSTATALILGDVRRHTPALRRTPSTTQRLIELSTTIPGVIERIVAYADKQAILALRLTSRALRTGVDKILARNVVVVTGTGVGVDVQQEGYDNVPPQQRRWRRRPAL